MAILESIERDRWNDFVARAPQGHLMQLGEWGAFKAALGWRVQRVGVERGGELIAGAQILSRSLPLTPFTVAYIPKGPLVSLDDEETADALFAAIHQAVRQTRAIALKIEPNMLHDSYADGELRRRGFQPTAQTNQPRATIVVDLAQGEAAVLAGMRKNTRKLVRRAAATGVTVEEGGMAELDDFCRIIHHTAALKRIPTHQVDFYRQAWLSFQTAQQTGARPPLLLLAKYQGETVAAKMVFFFRERSMHLWGGTSQKGREVHASYLIQWEAIKRAMALGCRSCDLWGIPDEVSELLHTGREIPLDRRDGLWGVYTFKRGFGGQVEAYVGAYDYAYRPRLYRLGIGLLKQSRVLERMPGWVERFSHRNVSS